MANCDNCDNEIENELTKGSKHFCSPACLKKYDEEHKKEDSHEDNICEFC